MSDNFKLLETKILSQNWYTLRKLKFEYKRRDGNISIQERESYDRGNGAAILLYNPISQNIILTRQFRIPTVNNGNPSGMMIEVCAGLLDQDSPDDCIRREALEETGYKINEVEKIFEAYMSPGAVTEKLHFYIGRYSEKMKATEGGGRPEEDEDIEVLELPFEDAYNMIQSGEIVDAKTILLLQYGKINNLL